MNPFQQLVQHAEAFQRNWKPASGMNPQSRPEQETGESFDRDLFDLLMLAMKCQQELGRR